MNNFYNFVKSADNYKKLLETVDEEFWIKWGQARALNLFQLASQRVPAYKNFLRINKINPGKIRTIGDFSKVPPINKKNYLTAYPIDKLCWDGRMSRTDMVSLSSGSSGEPFFWLRSLSHDQETALSHEVFLLDSFEIDKYSTLFIVSFAMGMWVAGTLTFRCVQDIASRYNMTVVTPGISVHEVLRIIKKLGPKYDQIVIAGYPPFVKDIIDEGDNLSLNLKKHKIRFLFAAEAFSEEWRNYIYRKVGGKDPFRDSINIYGTADSLILGHETPLSIFIRRKVLKEPSLYKNIFSTQSRAPTLAQFNPALRYFENINDKLIFSAFSGIPLIRYDIGDEGRVINYSQMTDVFKSSGINIEKEAGNKKINSWKLPFIYILGRKDHTASLYGINIYPENIRDALNLRGIDNYVSGKFVMMTKNDEDFDQYLDINIELKNKKLSMIRKRELGEKIKEAIIETLSVKNKEFKELQRSIGKRAEPHICLWPYGYKDFFPQGVKQKWYKK